MQLSRFKNVFFFAFVGILIAAVVIDANDKLSETETESTTTTTTTEAPSTTTESSTSPSDDDNHDGTISRVKRQWGCPSGCFSTCQNSYQCKKYNVKSMCVRGCCCLGSSFNISTACDGDAAVAACLNGLCGQGYFCSNSNYCCRCQSGSAAGPCVNGYCPAGYACNTNDYCCPIGSSSALTACVNGACASGYTCGAGNLCYLTTTG